MRVPKQELPDEKQIEEYARLNLPEHYRLVAVRCSYESMDDLAPEDFQINIEFVNLLDEVESGGMEALSADHAWTETLIEKIRSTWPPATLRICFKEKSVADEP
jgi:hypothetical protein